MNSIPLATIGITCFNAENSILNAIESALKQTYSNLEVIIVDDASIDNSVSRIEKYIANKDQGKIITLIQHPENKGAPSAYNSIIENAKGKYIAFFDDDDFSHADRIEKTVQALENEDSSELVCFCDRYVKSANKESVIKGLTRVPVSSKELLEHMLDTLCYHYDRNYYRKNQQRFHALKQHGLGGSSAGTGIMTAPAEILKRYLFDPKMYRFCDTELNLRMFQGGIGAINIDTPLMTQTMTSGADKNSLVEKESAFHALSKHRKTLQTYGIYYPLLHSIDDDFGGPKMGYRSDTLPMVTIGIITENSAETIFDVIMSAQSQTYPNIEIIIVDNASTDATLDILTRIEDIRLTITRNKSQLPKSENLNAILSRAKGEYTLFFDDKDITLKHRVESQVNGLLEQGEEPELSIADYYDYTNNFVGVHHCLGTLGTVVDSQALKSVIWYIVVRHSEAKYLLSDYAIPLYEYSLFVELLCGKTKLLKQLGFKRTGSDVMSVLDMLLRFSEMNGVLINNRRPLVQKTINPLRCSRWLEVVEASNSFIKSNQEGFEEVFGSISGSVIYRNNLKVKLMKRMSFIRKYL